MRRNTFRLALAGAGVLAAFAGAQGAGAQEPAKQPTARGTGGAAATVDALGTQAAIDTLKAGGNAVDAAVAAAGVLGVTEPFSCGIGGGGFMVIRTARGKVTTIDGREKAPRSMKPDSFWENGKPLAFDPARFSGLSAGVPGTPLTWARALKKYGTISLAEALAPGVRVATNGFTVDQTFYDSVEAVKTYFDDVPSTAAIYLDPDRSSKDVGTRITNPDMAKTYRLLGRVGVRKGFYSGAVAAAMAKAATQPPTAADADHTWRPGLMTTDDLKRYTAPERAATESSYRGLSVFGMGPPSSGGTTVAEVLNILGGYTPAGASREEILHRYLEASRYTFADRNAYVADPAFFDVPVKGLTSTSFADERRALITDKAAKSPVPAGDPYDNQGSAAKPAANTATISHPRQSTTHLTVADKLGNVVSYTFTIESTGGNGIVVPGYGFLLNNELTDFNYDSTTHPNRVEGSKRPRSSMAPTIIEKKGKPFLALGSPGGSTIPGTVLQTIVNRIDLREPL
ncbi:MAG TPA: gamma-glutamyltransferase, partial [Solirubrobacteraceae bacterium]|nr:gamma-glutamyltransferase [Solirubrobacteraceae bacterium]